MGMFDSIIFKCEVCGKEIEAQSKSGDCCLARYTPDSVPQDVAVDANRHAPFRCSCGAEYKFDPFITFVSLKIKKLK